MDHGGGGMGDGGMMSMNSTTKHYTSITFFWGKDSEILFSAWPGTRGGMYALALVAVFLLGLLVEWLGTLRFFLPPPPAGRVSSGGGIAAGLGHTVLHALRVGTAYLLMLAVMSFNGGVFIVAVTGRAVGFLLFTRPELRKEATDCCP